MTEIDQSQRENEAIIATRSESQVQTVRRQGDNRGSLIRLMPMNGIRHLSHNVHGCLRSSTIFFDLPRVVEELVHNSVDAGSTKVVVTVSIKACYVKVEDDGCGITRDGLVVLGERFATSKIHLVADGDISTEALGFRGETFSSLSDISLVEIRSKARGKPNAYFKVMKSSKCLFLGIDDERDGVGTTVTLRDLFYNQPIRRKYFQSSPKKVLHCVKNCVFRIALVHPQVLFKVYEIDSDDKLLCTVPSSSSLPLVIDGFGNEVSCTLREITYSDGLLSLSGHISGPMDALSTQHFEEEKVWSAPAAKHFFLVQLNGMLFFLSLRMQSYCFGNNFNNNDNNSNIDYHLTYAKMRKMFSCLCVGLEFSIANIVLAGLFPEGIVGIDLFSGGTENKSKLMEEENNIHFHEHSSIHIHNQPLSGPKLSNRLEISSDNDHQKHSLPCKGLADSISLCNKWKIEDAHGQMAKNFFEFELNNLEDTLDADCIQPTYKKSYKRDTADFNPSPLKHCLPDCIQGELPYEDNISDTNILKEEDSLGTFEPYGILDESFGFPQNCHNTFSHGYAKGDSLLDNEVFASELSSSGFGLDDNVCIKDVSSNKGECTTLTNWKSKYVNTSNDLTLQKNISNDLLDEILNSSQSTAGVIRKWRTSRALDTPFSCSVSPFPYDKVCLTNQNSLGHGHFSDYVDTESKFGYSLRFGSPQRLLTKTPKFHDFFNDFTLKGYHMNSNHADNRIFGMEECNAESINSVLDTSNEVLPDLRSTKTTKYVRKFCTNPGINWQDDFLLEHFIPTKKGSPDMDSRGEVCLLSESCNSDSEIHNTVPSLVENHDEAVEIPCNNRAFHTRIQTLRSRRSRSAPPFYEGKKKIPILKSRTVNVCGENTGKMSHGIDLLGQKGQPEHCGVLQRVVKPIEELSSACSWELNCKESNELIKLKNGPVVDELDSSLALPMKWRTGNPLPLVNNDAVMSYDCFEQKGDILDITSGLLHLTGNSLVPESLSKDCLDDAKVLPQLDRKFIPAVASGMLVIIDQHAADERIRLERLRGKVLCGELSSITYLDTERELVLPEMGYQLLQKYVEQIKKWGWICNINSQSVPHILGIDLSDKDLLEYLEQLVETGGSSIIPPSVLRILNFKACRGAIMFGDALLPTECSLIVEELKSTSLCFQCAHGRPTTVPLVNLTTLREQLARFGMHEAELSAGWHGLIRRPPSVQRARHRLELS
ncbi:DNA mismatch repair protein MLH3 [Apostasia shenzhenica]|uniref:DNA mismatch repair protein MLH3 n=1 Tax=Apostasia shenzhenica TaxID=1088818 RepID=A0A2I0ALW0_9ASPA|nr:DNA mismatch repair protein MLH3 [Apostasia shenzhenica]